MKEEDRNLIIENIGAIIRDASSQKTKVTNIENFFYKILDCHDKIKYYPTYQTDSDAELTLKRAKAGWDILLPCYNSISLLRKRELSIDKIEKKFSNKWIPFFVELYSKKFAYETIRLPTIQEEKEIMPPIKGSPTSSRSNSAATFTEKEGLTTKLKLPPIPPK